ncbi:MAG: DNA polymerase III subunit gamma/tau [Halothiobacillaceae bacterium]|nr:DNA polymerase III subunit gamma/tau [Halothiobacillaceae bacterium]
MSYQVLARKWRPRTFGEVVGQEHVLRALVNALDEGRLHHAYLFTGTRGVGKTTLARIFAKSLNCERGLGSSPCGECSTCREIDAGRYVDLIEVDAASRTGVDDTRELLDNVQYLPSRGRYKVYLIDEVHMFSRSSFNALLKTLEEPPPHIKFLLATTDPQKLPVTVLSRCLQFNLKALDRPRIEAHLATILEREGVGCEPRALAHLARAAEGSLRDALSLLDQAIAFGEGFVAEAGVIDMLGLSSDEGLFALLEALAGQDGTALFAAIERLGETAPDFSGVLAELIALLHAMALCRQLPEAPVEVTAQVERLRALAERLPAESLQLYYQIALLGRRDLPLAPTPRMGFEMTLLRMLAFAPESQAQVSGVATARGPAVPRPDSPAPSAPLASGASVPAAMPVERLSSSNAPSTALRAAASAPVIEPVPAVPSVVAPPGEIRVPVASTSLAAGGTSNDWPGLIRAMGLKAMVLMLAENCLLERIEDDAVHLVLPPSHSGMNSQAARDGLTRALEKHFGRPMRLNLRLAAAVAETPAVSRERERAARQQQAAQVIDEDPLVRHFIARTGAAVIPESIQPIETGDRS